MKNIKSLKDSFAEIKEILWKVYGVASLLDGDDIVLNKDSKSLGSIDATKATGVITSGMVDLEFELPSVVYYRNPARGVNAYADIKKDASGRETRTLKVNQRDFFSGKNTTVTITATDGHVCISRVSYSKKDNELRFDKKERLSIVFNEDRDFRAGHIVVPYKNSEKLPPYSYVHFFNGSESNDEKSESRLCSFASECMNHISRVLPNHITPFLALVNPIMYEAIQRNIVFAKPGKVDDKVRRENTAQYSKQFFTSKH